MANVLLIIHLIIALFLIAVVLLQRSEGGALGMGGGGGGMMTGRGAATALSKVTWGLAAAFIATSLFLTIIASRDRASESVVTGSQQGVPTSDQAPLPLPLPDLGDANQQPSVPTPAAD